MSDFTLKIDPLTNEAYYEVQPVGQRLLENPMLNKGSAFTEEERLSFNLTGLLRSAYNTIDEQAERVEENYRQKSADLERYIYLQSLQDRNETLFFRVLSRNLKEMLPIVYTPVVGEACLKMSHILRQYRGVFISPQNISHIDDILNGLNRPDLSLIVATDGERILGLGDLGSDGMGISVGKINLYIAAAGIHPSCCLPVCLDVGTNNERLLKDPIYLGWRHPRLTGQDYDDFVEKFVLGVRRSFPNALLQWEDFGKHHAFKLLERYRDRILSFNDDIQGTGATARAALLTAMRIKKSTFGQQQYVIAGLGQAGLGIAYNIMTILEEEGYSREEIQKKFFAYEIDGLVMDDAPRLDDGQRFFAKSRAAVTGWHLERPDRISLLDIVKNTKATVLIGVTGCTGLFDQAVLSTMGQNTDRPVILSLSNPTSKSECTPATVIEATQGRALVATGSPYAPVEYQGRTLVTSQCNNLYIFPGVGLGVLVSKALKVTDPMFLAASKALSAMVTPEEEAKGLLLPAMQDIRKVSAGVALAVAKEARDKGLGRLVSDEVLADLIAKAEWDPHYYPYRRPTR
jgi:malate dehydrogenase (oxaloacetate-decarboxylating)